MTRTISHLLRMFSKYVLTTLQNSSDSFNHLYCSVEVFPCIPGYIVQIVGLAIWKTNRNFKMILSQQLDRPSPYQTWIIHREYDCLQPLFANLVFKKFPFKVCCLRQIIGSLITSWPKRIDGQFPIGSMQLCRHCRVLYLFPTN